MKGRLPRPIGILPLGDAAAYVEFTEKLDLEVNLGVQRLAAALRARRPDWVRDVVPALGGLALHFDLEHPQCPETPLETAAELVEALLRQRLPPVETVGRKLEVPVCYDADLALDLAEVAQRTRLSPAEVVRRHAAPEYFVLMVGFAPGHPYLGGLDPRLAVPRRDTPRPAVPGGSIAIANVQSVIYPYAIPGGWSVIGRTPLAVFDARRDPPSLFAPGDRVRFVPIDRAQYERLRRES